MPLKTAQAYHTAKGDKNKATSTSSKGKEFTSKSLSVNSHVSSGHSMAKQLSSKQK